MAIHRTGAIYRARTMKSWASVPHQCKAPLNHLLAIRGAFPHYLVETALATLTVAIVAALRMLEIDLEADSFHSHAFNVGIKPTLPATYPRRSGSAQPRAA